MTSREAILEAVRAHRPASVPLPDVQATICAFPKVVDDLVSRFTESARAAGARVMESQHSDASPELAGAELFMCKADLGVAENGAVWLHSSKIGDHASMFLCSDLLIFLNVGAIVPTLHDAYTLIDIAAEPYGVFVAGPSKTADIEQSLVIGAHGPKSLTIVLDNVALDAGNAKKAKG